MDAKRIEELLAPYLGEGSLAPEQLRQVQLKQVQAHLGLLLKWNAKMNLTAVRSPEEIITRHFGESFFAARKLLKGDVAGLIDLGSGAGFPGVPMAIYAPQTKITLIESQNKKATFLKEVARTVGLRNVEVFGGRAEDYPAKADLVTFRAVEKFEGAVKTAAGLLASGGQLALMIGASQQDALPGGFDWITKYPVPGTSGSLLAIGKRKEESRE